MFTPFTPHIKLYISGLHYGHIHEADLGDGFSRKSEQFLARQTYFPIWGTCWESAVGGNHFRAWKQNGTLANSGAWFLAVSKEEDAGENHTIVPDGYNLGRDLLVEKAVGGSRWRGMWWKAEVEWREGLLDPGKKGGCFLYLFIYLGSIIQCWR